MTQNDFVNQQRAAVERMREINSRSAYKSVKGKAPDQNEVPKKPSGKTSGDNNSLQIPILDKLLSDGDSVLILGLLLILMSEKADKMLLFALLYILM